MTHRIRVGVVGVGHFGNYHSRIYADMPDVEFVGVADKDFQQAQSVAERYNTIPYTNFHDLIEKVDAISITVPTIIHKEVSLPFIEAGIHVLLEKPVADSLEDAVEIVDASEKAGVILQIGHLERYNAGIMELKKQRVQPRFIEVHRLGKFVPRATDVDVVSDLMIHDIDIVLSLVNSGIKSVSANGVSVLTDHIDIANARLEFENGAVANVTASRISTKQLRRIRIFSRNNYHALNFADQQLEVVKVTHKHTDTQYPEIISEKLQIEPNQPLDAELADFINTVRTNGIPLVSGKEALHALKVAHQVKEKINACL